MKWPFVNGHCIPPEEMDEHIPDEECDCQPQMVFDAENQVWYRHNRFDNSAELLQAAESIKAAQSVLLHQNAELKRLKMQVYPYAMQKIQLPNTSTRYKVS